MPKSVAFKIADLAHRIKVKGCKEEAKELLSIGVQLTIVLDNLMEQRKSLDLIQKHLGVISQTTDNNKQILWSEQDKSWK